MEEGLEALLRHYGSGNYDKCVSWLSSLSDSSGGMRLFLNTTFKDKLYDEFLIENNFAVCQSINKLMNNGPWDNWLDSMNRFINIHSKYRSLTNFPLELELNNVYNMLWWFLIKPRLQFKTLHFKSLLDSVSMSLIKVLKSSGEVVFGLDGSDSALVTLLEKASNVLLQLPACVSTQLLGIMALTVLVLQQSAVESVAKCMSFLKHIVKQLPLLKLHLTAKAASGNEEFCFRFGLTQVNSTASVTNSCEVIEGFVVTSSVIFAVNGDIELSRSCLENMPTLESNSFQFLVNYVKGTIFKNNIKRLVFDKLIHTVIY